MKKISKQIVVNTRVSGVRTTPGLGVANSVSSDGGKQMDVSEDISLGGVEDAILVIKGSFDSDSDAADAGLAIDDAYIIATADNEYSLPVGTVKLRKS